MKTQIHNEIQNEQKVAQERFRMMTYGRFRIEKNGMIIVDELPIGRWNHIYRNLLKKMVAEKIITDFQDKCNDYTEEVEFHIYGMDSPTYEKLHLIKSYGLTNMVLLDLNNKPKKYKNIQEILEDFYEFRFPFFEKRRQYFLSDLLKQKGEFDGKLRFVSAVVHKQLNIVNRFENEIRVDLQNLQIPYSVYDNAKANIFTNEKIQELQNKINDLQNKIDYYNKVTPTQLWLNDIADFEKHLAQTKY